jgi:hypothetical protein
VAGVVSIVWVLVTVTTGSGSLLFALVVGAWGGVAFVLIGLLQRWKARRGRSEPRPNSHT